MADWKAFLMAVSLLGGLGGYAAAEGVRYLLRHVEVEVRWVP